MAYSKLASIFQATGYKLVVITNQGVNILNVFFYTHGPESPYSYRKPQPGMLLEARDKFDIDMSNS